jgi:hypothetical protein
MNPLHNGLKGNRPLITFCTFLILSFIYFISITFTSLPGTYAWFTSETSASGTIQNATTEDLLLIQSSDIEYGSNCSIEHSLSVKNISDMNTNVSIFLQSGSGEELITSQKLKPGESFKTEPNAISGLISGCEATSVDYHIKGFINYVDETYDVAIDSKALKETIVPVPDDSILDEKPKEQDETKVEKQKKTEPEKEVDATEEETSVKEEAEEEEQPAIVEPANKPQVEEDVSSNEQPEENVIEESPEEKQVEETKEGKTEQSEQANSVESE